MPMAFLEFDLEMKLYMLSGVKGLNSNSNRSRDVDSYCLDAVMVYYVLQDRFRCYVSGDIYIELVHSTRNRDFV